MYKVHFRQDRRGKQYASQSLSAERQRDNAIESMRAAAKTIRHFLEGNAERQSAEVSERRSNPLLRRRKEIKVSPFLRSFRFYGMVSIAITIARQLIPLFIYGD
jgi:hypothetical protein